MLATILRVVLGLGAGFTSTELLVLQAIADATEGALHEAPPSHCHRGGATGHSPR